MPFQKKSLRFNESYFNKKQFIIVGAKTFKKIVSKLPRQQVKSKDRRQPRWKVHRSVKVHFFYPFLCTRRSLCARRYCTGHSTYHLAQRGLDLCKTLIRDERTLHKLLRSTEHQETLHPLTRSILNRFSASLSVYVQEKSPFSRRSQALQTL